jgi:hypothetical protein
MTNFEVQCVILSFAIIIVATGLEMLHWLPGGHAKFVLLFLAGAGTVGALRAAAIPPWWFAGGSAGFGLAVSLLLGGWVTKTAEERSFGLPLLTGMGSTLLVLNTVAHL